MGAGLPNFDEFMAGKSGENAPPPPRDQGMTLGDVLQPGGAPGTTIGENALVPLQGPPPKPTFEQFMAGQQPAQSADSVYHSPATQAVLSEYLNSTAIGRVLDAFGQGAKDGWGAGPSTLSPESEEWLKKVGVFNDYENGRASLIRSFNEALIRPVAVGLSLGQSLLTAGFGAYQSTVGQAFDEAGMPILGRDIAALPEAAFGGRLHTGPGLTATLNGLSEARSLGIIGTGEAGWKGTAAPLADDTAQMAATKEAREALLAQQPEVVTGAVPGELPPPQETPPDIHVVARQVAPEVFAEYDPLAIQRDALRRQIDDLAEVRANDATAVDLNHRIDDILSKVPIEERLTNAQTRRLGDLRDQLGDYLTTDTPDMAAVRRDLMAADEKMRDLAPQVGEAYRTAATQMPTEAQTVIPPPEVRPPPIAAETTEEPVPAPISPIVQDVTQKLIAAGRPTVEAQLAAELIDAHYNARAQRFGGVKGSAQDLYNAEAPDILAGGAQKRGQISLGDATTAIKLMKNADASTFIHETGHAWLEELMRDATDVAAPAELRDDAVMVRQWLGVGDEARIPTRAHEKFARGFERYMMEGRAPSAGLVDVFRQFKQWLTGIYQTVSRLRAPITDDIRSVFDRMLATRDQGTIVTPDHETVDFASRHEMLAGHIPPEEAGLVADHIREEADQIAAERAPEIHAELTGTAERGTEAGRGEAAGEEPDRNAVAPRPVAGDAQPPGPTGEVGEGGGTITAEGTQRTAAEQSAAANAERPLSRSDTALVDKAGNIRIDNLNVPADVAAAIRQAADENNEFIDQRRGVISDAEVQDLADALGMSARILNRRKIGAAFNAEEIIAARKLLIQSATEVRDAAAKAAEGSETDLLTFAQAKDRHAMIQGQVAGVTAEAGRALRAFHALEGQKQAGVISQFLEDATGRTLNQLQQEARSLNQLETPQQVSKFVADSQKKGFFDWMLSYFVNGLISGPATHGTYLVGNQLLALSKATTETAASALVSGAREIVGWHPQAAGADLISSEADRIRLSEVQGQLLGMMYGQRKGLRAAWQAFKTNESVMLPGEDVAAGTAFQGTGRGTIPNPEIGGVRLPIGDVIESPGRLINAIHSFSRVTGYSQSLWGQAYRIAHAEGLVGDALAARINELGTNPTAAMMAEGIKNGTENAMMRKPQYQSFSAMLSRFVNVGIPIPDVPLPGGHALPMGTLRPLKFIDPFVTIAANIFDATLVKRTPLGILSSQMREDLSGANGGAAFDLAAGRMLAGTAFMGAMGSLAAEGLVTGSGPADPKEAAALRLTGWQPHSIRIGDMYYETHRLGVIGMLAGISADLYDVAHKIGTEDASKVASQTAHAFAQNILDESFMRGPADMIRAIEESDRFGARYVQQMIASFAVPFSVGMGQIARQVDPYTRLARSTMDAILTKIPVASESLFPRRDIWGEPMPNRPSIIPGALAIYETKLNDDPVNAAMLRLAQSPLHYFPAMPERKIRGVQLTDQQYDDYTRIAGRFAKAQLDRMVRQAAFNSLPIGVQHEMISKVISQSREIARSQIMMQNPDIIRQAIQAKHDNLLGIAP